MVKNWLITGGCGFIGSSLIQMLLALDDKINIRVLDNLSVGSRADLKEVTDFKEIDANVLVTAPQGIELIVGDVKDAQVCQSVSQGIDCIVHLAANTGVGPSVEDPRGDMEANVMGTFNILEAARASKVDKFIFASSGAPVGECIPPIHEELAAHPVSPYGASKLAGEGYCSAFFRSFGLKTIALRFGNVYGPRSKHKSSVVAKFILKAINGKTCEVYGTGKQTRDFIYIDDLLDAIIKASHVNVGGEVFQIATNKESTVNEIVGIIQQALQKINIDMNVVFGERRTGDVMRNFSDTSKSKKILGWEPKTDLYTGIERTLKYFSKI